MKKLIIVITACCSFFCCNAQNNGQPITEKKQDTLQDSNTENTPKVNINVNKEYDEEGNLIGFDSTYSYSYSNVGDDSLNLDIDSLFNGFSPSFFRHSPGIWSRHFDDLFFNDSLLHNNFFNDDYFFNRFERNLLEPDDVFRRMDSLKNKYFKGVYPDTMEDENADDSIYK